MGLAGEDMNSETMANGFVQAENGHTVSENQTGSSADSVRTYKRRKRALEEDCQKSSGESAVHIQEKPSKGFPGVFYNECSCSLAHVAGNGSNASIPVPHDFPLTDSRNLLLVQMFKALDVDGSLPDWLQSLLLHNTENGCASEVKDSVHSFQEGRKSTSLFDPPLPGIQSEAKSMNGVILNASLDNGDHQKVSELCKRTLCNILMSEKFAILCNVLLENFHGIKVGKLLDIGFMNSRLKEGVYEKSPVLFLSDIQQIWTKLQNFGTELVKLSKNLSEKSIASYQEQMKGLSYGTSTDGPCELVTQQSDLNAKMEQVEACTCKQCGGKVDGKDFMVCDSCEEMYHVSCIKLPVGEISSRSWYCTTCTMSKEIESPHHNCVVCERLTSSRSLISDGVDELSNAETFLELEESSSGFTDEEIPFTGGITDTKCNICRSEVKNGEKLKICGHDMCAHKFYHARCLTNQQLDSCGPRWYCPSCLCRACLVDRDDEKIVLCDCCDQAYHIYCMQSPLDTIPCGDWYCRKCNAEMRRIRLAKRSFEDMRNKGRTASGVGKASHKNLIGETGKEEEGLEEKSGGVDMLLNAAITLNNEENKTTSREKN